MSTNNTSPTNNLKVSELDFDTIKSNFKAFLKGQDTFKDYNFEGSSLSVLLDILAYNTHYMSFYANMVANEMFLDTATLRESIASRAKMLGYTPRSRKASIAYVDLVVYVNIVSGTTAPSSITLKKYAEFSSSVNDIQYRFVTLENKVLDYSASNSSTTQWAYVLNNVDVYEGSVIDYSFNVTNPYSTDFYSPGNRFIIPSSTIDTDTLVVSVQESDKVLDSTVFEKADVLVGKDASSTIYWLNETENFYYEIKFGDGVTFGKALQTGNIIKCSYLSTNGTDANGCKTFSASSQQFSGWPTGLALEGVTTTTTASSYIRMRLNQQHVSNFKVGEEVTGADSGAKGKVISWDSAYGNLTVVPISGYSNNFKYVKTTNGYLGESIIAPSTATGIITLISRESSISSSGAERESDDSIRLLAPLSYQTQNRCVTIKDYEHLIKRQFYSTVKSIKVWSGESMTEPQYGKVFIAICTYNGQLLSNVDKNNIITSIKEKNILSIQPEIVDVDFIYVVPVCSVKYNPSQFNVKFSTIENVITQGIKDFNDLYLTQFGTPFYYSDFITYLKNLDSSILSVNVDLTLKKNLDIPFLTSAAGTIVNFSNAIKKLDNSTNINWSVKSSSFVFRNGLTETSGCQLAASKTNNDILVVIDSNENIVTGGENVGTINYSTGTITFNKFIVSSTTVPHPSNSSFEGRVEISINTVDKDAFSNEHQVIEIASSDSSYVTATDIRNIV